MDSETPGPTIKAEIIKAETVEAEKIKMEGIETDQTSALTASQGQSNPDQQSTEAAWRNCGHLKNLQQIETKEKAVKDALTYIEDLESLLGVSNDMASASKWLARIKEIRERCKKNKILIGLLGVSGSGKSSLINALLGEEDLMPGDDERACTAVVSEVSYQTNEDIEVAYEARIQRISQDDWKAELTSLFQDLRTNANIRDGEDGEEDLERNQRIQMAFGKVQSVYPFIESSKKLEKDWDVAKLMNHSSVKYILGKSLVLTSAKREKFSKMIKPYISSVLSKGDDGAMYAQWPLVKLVKVYVRSPLLQDGIVLVDLPGSMDTNAARGAIAAEYQKNLTINCIVAPIQRAATDKPAQELLGSVTQRTLQLDNKLPTESVCFIVTKIDSSLKVDRYIREHPKVQEMLTDEFEKELRISEDIESIKVWCEERKKRQAEDNLLMSQLKKESKQLAKICKKPKKAGRSKKRKAGDDGSESNLPPETEEQRANRLKFIEIQKSIAATKKRIGDAGTKLYKAHERMQLAQAALERSQSRQRFAYIKNRNEVVITALRADFEIATMALPQEKKKPLPVFCVSSLAFFESVNNSHQPFFGFPKMSHTNIPNLRTWVIETTLPSRDHSAMAFLEDVEGLQVAMKLWFSGATPKYLMTSEKRSAVETLFNLNFDQLEKRLAKLEERLIESCQRIVKNGLISKLSKFQAEATEESQKVVRNWPQKPMHWGIHRAINRAKGVHVTRKDIKYDWVEELVACYLVPLQQEYTNTLHDNVPKERTIFDDAVSKVVNEFLGNLTNSLTTICPQLSQQVEQWRDTAMRVPGQIHEVSREIFHGPIAEAGMEGHGKVQPKVAETWEPIFVICGNESGRGHYKRNQNMHNEHIKANAHKMYQKASRAVSYVFIQLWKALPEHFSKGVDPILAAIREEFLDMVVKNTDQSGLGQIERMKVESRLELTGDVLDIFQGLKAAWAQGIIIMKEEDEEDVKPNEIHLGNLDEISGDNDEDSYDEDSDDYESEG
ncbi:hypothetical protein HYALB_00003032 [Hymenoscyphus albidus]|uniref:Uncharacterized protein n=1 Tax=Hymenoscyphus albidus TaxID=595503 RepID=A0A9N9LXC6_9HELO|nr:hypothetical protein HYALB_00003032 [Hymenoscyphus albidus]